MPPRYFTVVEANALLPQVRHLVERILQARQEILVLQPQLWPAVEKAALNGGGKAASDATQHIMRIQEAVHALTDMGIEIKDLNSGLIDFPAQRHGDVVLLCWRYNEPAVEYWHSLEDGFAGRRPISEWDV